MKVESVPDPKILNSRDAIVRVTSTRICGSDLHLYNGFVPTLERGDVLGHEFMGEVVDVGRASAPQGRRPRGGAVPHRVRQCSACQRDLFAACENSNPNAWMAEKLWGHSPAGIFGYSHLSAASPAGRPSTCACRSPTSGRSRCPNGMSDDQVLFLSDILPTGYMGAEMCDIKRGDVIAVWGAGPVGQFAIASAYLLGAER
jgi:threonine dehydrogenase-like Zn-dependent dehydrogenase